MAMTAMQNVAPYVDATELLDDPAALRWRAKEDGCLFFKGLLTSEKLLDLRRQIMGIVDKHGWLEEGTAALDGVAKKGLQVIESGDPRWQAFYCDVLKLRDFHALALDGALVGALEVLFGEKVLPHPRNICRLMFPQSAEYSTPPHQDHFYIGGSDETWTGWIPLGDCPVQLGSLAVAKGSHREGMKEVHKATGAGGHGVEMDAETVWYGGDFACGDVLFLHSKTVHQGRDNLSGDRLRLSVDYRYQPRSHPVRADSLLPHMGWVGWEEVYAGWEVDDALKYYWDKWDLEVTSREG